MVELSDPLKNGVDLFDPGPDLLVQAILEICERFAYYGEWLREFPDKVKRAVEECWEKNRPLEWDETRGCDCGNIIKMVGVIDSHTIKTKKGAIFTRSNFPERAAFIKRWREENEPKKVEMTGHLRGLTVDTINRALEPQETTLKIELIGTEGNGGIRGIATSKRVKVTIEEVE